MTAPMLKTNCPTEETLAAYVDDRLDAATRMEVTKHLASCGECRELVLMATDLEMSEMPANVVRGPFGWFATAAALAAAAVLAIVVLKPAFVYGPDIDDVNTAVQSLAFRPGSGRTGGAPYKKEPPKLRGELRSDDDGKATLYGIAADAKDPHVQGLAFLFTATNAEELDGAMQTLDKAHAGASGDERDASAVDLAAALLAFGGWRNDAAALARALQLADDVWKRTQSAEAAWNRAAALEALGRSEDAIRAWDDYLKLDPNSEWAAEATQNRDGLRADPSL